MKRRIFLYTLVSIGILLNGCANKQITSENNINNEIYNETRVVLKACSEKEDFIKVDTNLTFMGKEYKDTDRYISELRICRVNASLVYVKLEEEVADLMQATFTLTKKLGLNTTRMSFRLLTKFKERGVE